MDTLFAARTPDGLFGWSGTAHRSRGFPGQALVLAEAAAYELE